MKVSVRGVRNQNRAQYGRVILYVHHLYSSERRYLSSALRCSFYFLLAHSLAVWLVIEAVVRMRDSLKLGAIAVNALMDPTKSALFAHNTSKDEKN